MSTRVCSKDGTIPYLERSFLESYNDVVLVSSEGDLFSSSRLVLASCSSYLEHVFNDHSQPPGEDVYLLTQMTSSNLLKIIEFVTMGTISTVCDIKAMDQADLDAFSAFGIHLASLELVQSERRNDLTLGLDWSSALITKCEPDLSSVMIKSEAIDVDFILQQMKTPPNVASKRGRKPGRKKVLKPKAKKIKETRKVAEKATNIEETVLPSDSEDDEDPGEVKDPDFIVPENIEVISQKPKRGRKKKTESAENSQPKKAKGEKKQKEQCPYCPKMYGCSKTLRQHIFRHENKDSKDQWYCIQCGKDTSFPSREELLAHRNEFHKNQTYSCTRCPKVFKGNYYHRYKKHLEEHDAPPRHVCISCGFRAKTTESLKSHRVNFGPFHDSKCASCESEFKSWFEHERHVVKEHNGEFKHKCGFCPQVFDTVQRQRIHRKEQHFLKEDTIVPSIAQKKKGNKSELEQVCEFCGKLVKVKYYDQHLVNNHGSGNYPCPQCGKVVNHPQILERHIKNFHNEFPCEQCGKTMRNRKKYAVHILSYHTPEHLKPYQCELCNPPKGFHTKTNLREHMNVHNNERPHKCRFCGAGFNSQGNRYAHERSSHLGIKRKK